MARFFTATDKKAHSPQNKAAVPPSNKQASNHASQETPPAEKKQDKNTDKKV